MSGENPKPVNIDPRCIQEALQMYFQPIKNDDPQLDFYTMYKRETMEYDTEYMQKHNEDLNTTLIFAGLFSAVSSAFVIDVQSKLEPDSGERSEAYLRAILLSLNRSISPDEDPAAPSAWNGPPQEIITASNLMYASLLMSLLAAFVAMLGKQWLNRYLRHTGGSEIERCGDRQRKFDGLQRWPFRFFIGSLHIMLQIALFLLTCGLSRYMWSVNTSVARVVVFFTVIGFLFYIGIVVAGTFSYECPFQTPASIALRHLRDSETARKWLSILSPLNVISPTCTALRDTRKLLASLSLPSAASLRMDARQGFTSASRRAHDITRQPLSWDFFVSGTLSGIRRAATKIGHRAIIMLLQMDRAFGNAKQRLGQGIRRFGDAGLLPTSTRDAHHRQPFVFHSGPGMRLRVWNLEGVRRQNVDNARCVCWVLRNITDPEAIDSAIRLAGTIRWFDGDSDHNPPFDLIVSAFEVCFDSTKQLYPGMRDRAYFSARAILQINMRARVRSQDRASKYPIPTVSADSANSFQHDDPDFFHLIHMLNNNLNAPRPILLFPDGASVTQTHSLWLSKLFVDFTRTGTNPILESYESYLTIARANHQATIANILLMWCMFLGGHVEEETIWAVDKSDSLEIILSHLSARVMATIANATFVEHLKYLLNFLAAWKERPACLTPMVYQWCSALSGMIEPDGAYTYRGPPIPQFALRDIEDRGFARVGPGCDLVHHSRGPQRRVYLYCYVEFLFKKLEIGFRLAQPGHGWPAIRLDHTSHHDRMFEVVFSSDDDEVIADAACAWIADSDRTPVGSFVHHLANRAEKITPPSPRLRQLGICAISSSELTVSAPETVRFLNRLRVDADDLDNEEGCVWADLLVGVIRSTGFNSLSSRNWRLLGKLPCQTGGFPRGQVARDMEVMRFLEKAEDWEKLEVWMGVVWRSLPHLGFWPFYNPDVPVDESMQNVEQVTLELSLRRPSALQKFKNLCKGLLLPLEHSRKLREICDRVQAEQLPPELPLQPESIHDQPLILLPFWGDHT